MKKYIVEVYTDRTVWTNEAGQLHREGGPAIERANGDKSWWIDDKLHREDGPAVEWTNGDKQWLVDGKFHRLDGPAIERRDGTKEWWVDGKLHREDGPAIEYASGHKEWYIEDERLSESEFNERINQITCENKIVKINGQKYKLVKA